MTLVRENSANFFAENCQKSPKIVIITSTPARKSWKERISKLGPIATASEASMYSSSAEVQTLKEILTKILKFGEILNPSKF
jgi:hypothetical protein